MKNKIVIHVIFVAAVTVAGALIGLLNQPADWYQGLAKPWFNPPGWVFGPVWTILYILIGIAGARAFIAGDRPRLYIWFAQMILNFLWSPAFFGLENPSLALAVILPMLALIVAFIWQSRRKDRPSVLLFLPYAAWVSFATLLNASIVALN